MKHLLLVGGGHAHLFVLEHLMRTKLDNVRVTLVSPSRWQDYSGMLPGWVAGIYHEDEARIDLKMLTKKAHVDFIEDSISNINADDCYVCLTNGDHIFYDVVSLDVGSETNLQGLDSFGDKIIPVKPLASFRAAWQNLINNGATKPHFTLGIIGAGAAGVEIAFAAAKRLNAQTRQVKIILIAGSSGVLSGHAPAVQHAALAALAKANVEVVNERVSHVNQTFLMNDGQCYELDNIIAATGAKPAPWLALSALCLNADGYIQVDGHHRSTSHANVFAAGDVCARTDTTLPRSGVHAVRVGPILAHNLVASLLNKPLKIYQPKQRSLYLLSCSNGRAIVSWGRLSAEGRWAWYLKDFIDRRFIKRFTNLGMK